ncbi:hypothetical protein LTS10_010420 [Elasticomyces elasticus]|nr:hypothetical protein LTS10_010420 [Elasticomyces elasticus]
MNPAISSGIAQLRYDLIGRIRGELDTAVVPSSKTQDRKCMDEMNGADGYVRLIREEGLQEAGLGQQLVGCLGFLNGGGVGADGYDDPPLTPGHGDGGNDMICHFAYAVVEGEKLGDVRCVRVKRELGEVFEFVYGVGFEEVAAEIERVEDGYGDG